MCFRVGGYFCISVAFEKFAHNTMPSLMAPRLGLGEFDVVWVRVVFEPGTIAFSKTNAQMRCWTR
jgi:hypothetical protein